MADSIRVARPIRLQHPHEVKKKPFDLGENPTHDLRIRSTVALPTELRGRTEKVGDDLGGESPHLNRPRLSLSDLVAQSGEQR